MTSARIDAHQHFWRYNASDFPWIADDRLRRDWLPQDLRPSLDACAIDACIAVQARADEAETDFLLALAQANPWILAVVGWVDLRADDLDARLKRWSGAPVLKGFRHLLQDDPDVAATLDDPAFNRGVRRLQSDGLVYELLVRGPGQLAELPRFCARHDRHWLVLDHVGKPTIGGNDDGDWQAALQAVAALPHAAVKLSGLVTEVVGPQIDDRLVWRYLDVALEAFGPDRLMFGSDWPVCLLRAGYGLVCAIVERWAETALGAAERAALWGANADRYYGCSLDRLPEPRP